MDWYTVPVYKSIVLLVLCTVPGWIEPVYHLSYNLWPVNLTGQVAKLNLLK